jgi:hypothetical protein
MRRKIDVELFGAPAVSDEVKIKCGLIAAMKFLEEEFFSERHKYPLTLERFDVTETAVSSLEWAKIRLTGNREQFKRAVAPLLDEIHQRPYIAKAWDVDGAEEFLIVSEYWSDQYHIAKAMTDVTAEVGRNGGLA